MRVLYIMTLENDSPLKKGGKINWREFLGSTTFIESRNLSHLVGCEKLYLKFEGGNPTGTQKDRIALAILENARSQGAKAVIAASFGNYGASLAWAARIVDIPVHIYIPENYHMTRDRLRRIKDAGAELYFLPGQYEDLVEQSSKEAVEKGWYNANPGSPGVKELSLEAYAEIAYEIYRDIRRAPNYVFCPVGNGTTLAGIYQGFKKLHQTGKIQALPRMVATGTRRGNPIVKSFLMKSQIIRDLAPNEVKESKIIDPLSNWHSYDGQEALDAIYESNGFADYASEAKIMEFNKQLRQEEGLYVLPAASSTLAVMNDLADNKVTVKGSFVAILTGRDFD
ncbi:pyridoxal-phosphate dependent enzyme [Candidatus Thorarchaeota archaeon]|nr:MAG: pyridoxal-phosphate dependent enzyme [Candidatus Thorarchaeota archaeon]